MGIFVPGKKVFVSKQDPTSYLSYPLTAVGDTVTKYFIEREKKTVNTWHCFKIIAQYVVGNIYWFFVKFAWFDNDIRTLLIL